MSHDTSDITIVKIAKAINGPWDLDGFYRNDPHELDKLRDHKWEMLEDSERLQRIGEALSVFNLIGSAHDRG